MSYRLWQNCIVVACLILLCLVSPQSLTASEISKELKQRLFDRYDKKNLNIICDKVLVSLLAEGPGFNGHGYDILEYSVNYDYFDQAFKKQFWPKKYQRRNLLDEFTTEEVEGGARFTDVLS